MRLDLSGKQSSTGSLTAGVDPTLCRIAEAMEAILEENIKLRGEVKEMRVELRRSTQSTQDGITAMTEGQTELRAGREELKTQTERFGKHSKDICSAMEKHTPKRDDPK